MKGAPLLATARGIEPFAGDGSRAALERLLPGPGPWEVEIGFGKGRHLLARAAGEPERRFLGIEVAGEYFALVARRLARHGLANLALIHGEALMLLAAELPRGFARALHVYFPDPWPKARHERRRLFSPASVDLLLAALEPGGTLCFATDHVDYGAGVRALLEACPGVRVRELPAGWPGGPRTNYEAKYEQEGRAILRLEAVAPATPTLHPEGARALLVGVGDAPPRSARDEGA
jgi:tRNA (guanine-N7-)-methyltransferase